MQTDKDIAWKLIKHQLSRRQTIKQQKVCVFLPQKFSFFIKTKTKRKKRNKYILSINRNLKFYN